MLISSDLLDDLLKNYEKPEDLLGKNGLIKQLTQALIERALEGEMTHHLGYEKHSPLGHHTGNSRNGKSEKSLKTEEGLLEIKVPRDRTGAFDPQLVKKGQRRFEDFDDKILSLYARGMSVRDIQGHLKELYGTEVSPDFISSVTDSILEEVKAWRSRLLDPLYPIVY